MIVEVSTKKNGHKPIAAVAIDLSKILNSPSYRAEYTLKLRPLIEEISSCILSFEISAVFKNGNNEKEPFPNSILSTPLSPQKRRETCEPILKQNKKNEIVEDQVQDDSITFGVQTPAGLFEFFDFYNEVSPPNYYRLLSYLRVIAYRGN